MGGWVKRGGGGGCVKREHAEGHGFERYRQYMWVARAGEGFTGGADAFEDGTQRCVKRLMRVQCAKTPRAKPASQCVALGHKRSSFRRPNNQAKLRWDLHPTI